MRPRLRDVLEDRLCPSGSYLLVTSFDTHNVLRYDATTGAFVDEFVPRKSGRLNQPNGLVIGPIDHDLYVTSGLYGGPGRLRGVLRFDGTTGAFLENFAGEDLMRKPGSILFGPDGNLYVADHIEGAGTNTVQRYDAATGAFLGDFVPNNSGGIKNPQGMVFGPDGEDGGQLDLYVASAGNGKVLRYDGTTGAFRGEFVAGGSGGLDHPFGITFGPDGNLYVADGESLGQGPVLRFQGPSGESPGAFIDTFVPAGTGGLRSPVGLIFGPDGNGDGQQDLYISNVDYAASLSHQGAHQQHQAFRRRDRGLHRHVRPGGQPRAGRPRLHGLHGDRSDDPDFPRDDRRLPQGSRSGAVADGHAGRDHLRLDEFDFRGPSSGQGGRGPGAVSAQAGISGVGPNRPGDGPRPHAGIAI